MTDSDANRCFFFGRVGQVGCVGFVWRVQVAGAEVDVCDPAVFAEVGGA